MPQINVSIDRQAETGQSADTHASGHQVAVRRDHQLTVQYFFWIVEPEG